MHAHRARAVARRQLLLSPAPAAMALLAMAISILAAWEVAATAAGAERTTPTELFVSSSPTGSDRQRQRHDPRRLGQPPPPLLLTEMTTMQQMRVRALRHDLPLSVALAALHADATALFVGNSSWVDGPGPWSVTDKTHYVAASGDVHDYFSTAKYCWPCNTSCSHKLFPGKECNAWLSGRDYHPHNCDNSTGLPWLCHDGFANPISADLDSGSWAELANAVPTLALSAFLADNEQHARRAVNLTRSWFLDPNTAMRPNLEYAQSIPGLNNGTHGGIIEWSDHHKLLDVLDGLTLLSASPNDTVASTWTSDDREKMMQWVAQLNEWMRSSNNAKKELSSTNNHGTWFDVMALGLAKYLSRSHDAGMICQAAPQKRIAKQVSGPNHGLPPGALPLEDRRTNTEHYHSQDTAGLLTLAQLCRSIGNHVPDLYTVEVKPEKNARQHLGNDTVSLRDVVDFVLPFITNVTGPRQLWPFGEAGESEPFYWAQVMRKAANGYKNLTYERVFQGLPQDKNIGMLQSQKYQLDLLQPFGSM